MNGSKCSLFEPNHAFQPKIAVSAATACVTIPHFRPHPAMLDILYRDSRTIAVNKPAGMLVHRSWLDRHETQFVMQTLRDQIGQHVYPAHRLDRPTSGVLLFALDPEAARLLTQQFEQKTTRKPTGQSCAATCPTKDSSTTPSNISPTKSPNPKPKPPSKKPKPNTAALRAPKLPFQSAARYPTSRYSWAELIPHTGRKHQLRRHMKHIFHPIVGDTNYGDLRQNHATAAHLGPPASCSTPAACRSNASKTAKP